MNNDNDMPPQVFTNAQLELLKMFSAKVPAEDWEAIRDYAKKYFAQKATNEMDKLFEENGWGEEQIEEWANAHMRTEYINEADRVLHDDMVKAIGFVRGWELKRIAGD